MAFATHCNIFANCSLLIKQNDSKRLLLLFFFLDTPKVAEALLSWYIKIRRHTNLIFPLHQWKVKKCRPCLRNQPWTNLWTRPSLKGNTRKLELNRYDGTIFNWVSKVIRYCFGFCSVIGPENLCHSLYQSDTQLHATNHDLFVPVFPLSRQL